MVKWIPAAKDVFAAQTRPQSLIRLLLHIVEYTHFLLNQLKCLSSGLWKTASDVYIDSADIRLYFWQSTRYAREYILKALALIDFISSPLYQMYGVRLIDFVSLKLDHRETFRRRAAEFLTIQWQPIGFGLPPCPTWPVEVAMDVLLGGGSYPRLPLLLEETVKQVGETDPASVLVISNEEKSRLQKRVQDEVSIMWALSYCPKDLAVISFENHDIVLTVLNEFSVRMIFDFKKCQILSAQLTVGSQCGFQMPTIIHIGFCSTLRQVVAILESKQNYCIEKLKQNIRTVWRKILQNPHDKDKWLNEITENLKKLKDLNDLYKIRYDPKICKITAGRNFDFQSELSNPIDYFFEIFCVGRWICSEIIFSSLKEQVLRLRNINNTCSSGIFKYSCNGSHYLSSSIKIENEQQLAAVTTQNAIQSLDVCFFSNFDVTIGGLIKDFLHLSILIEDNPYISDCLEMLPSLQNDAEQQSTSKTSSVNSMISLSLSGCILRFKYKISEGSWHVCLWPISPLLWFLKNISLLSYKKKRNTQKNLVEGDVEVKSYKAESSDVPIDIKEIDCYEEKPLINMLHNLDLQNFQEVIDSLSNDASLKLIEKLSTDRLELIQWMGHCCTALSTLALSFIANYIKTSSNPFIQTDILDLKGSSNNISAHRSLSVTYLKYYTIILYIDIHDGSIRVTSRSSSLQSWLRLPCASEALDLDLAAALANSPNGIKVILKLLPHIKYLAFIQRIRKGFRVLDIKECLEIPLETFEKFLDSPFITDTPHRKKTDLLNGFNDYELYYENKPINLNRSLNFADYTESPESNRLVQKFHSQGTVESGLHTLLPFLLHEYNLPNSSVVLIVLIICIENWSLTKSYISVIRCRSTSKNSLIAKFKVDHPVYDLSENLDDREFSEHLNNYWKVFSASFEYISSKITQIAALATLKDFPFYILSLNQPSPNLFAMNCAPSNNDEFWSSKLLFFKSDIQYIPANSSRENTYHLRAFSTEENIIIIETETKPNITCAKIILKTENGFRIPPFLIPKVIYSSTSIHLINNPEVVGYQFSLVHNFGCAIPCYDDLIWGRCNCITISVQADNQSNTEDTSEGPFRVFSSSLLYVYKTILQQLKVMSYFFKGIHELYATALIRSDIQFIKSMPNEIEVAWHPWPIHNLDTKIFSQPTILTPPSVTFYFSVFEPPMAPNEFILSLWWGFLVIKSSVMYPILQSDRVKMFELFELCSPWEIVRYIISVYELHSSIHYIKLLPNFYKPFEKSSSKLEPSLFMWSHSETNVRTGTESLIYCPVATSAVPNIIDSILLSFNVMDHKISESKSPTKVSVQSTELVPLLLRIKSNVTASTVYNEHAILSHAFNVLLLKFLEGISCLYQNSPQLYNPELPWYVLSPCLYGLKSLDNLSDIIFDIHGSKNLQITHSVYYFPGRLLKDVIIPLTQVSVTWVNAIASALSISRKTSISRQGILLLSKNTSAKITDPSIRKTILGTVTWRNPTPVNQPLDQFFTPIDHTLELRIVPIMGRVFRDVKYLQYATHPPEPEDDIFQQIVPIKICTSSASTDVSGYTEYMNLFLILLLQNINLSLKETSNFRQYQQQDWFWHSDYNILCFPNSFILNSSFEDFDIYMNTNINEYNAIKNACDELIDLSTAKIIFTNYYTMLHPSRLILPYETDFFIIPANNITNEPSNKRIRDDSLPVTQYTWQASIYSQIQWLSPVRPHTAERADGSFVELQYTCNFELKSVPARPDWTVVSNYFKMFDGQACTEHFSFLIRLLQYCSGSAVSQVASILDTALQTTRLHIEILSRHLQGYLEYLSNVPFVTLNFKKPPIQCQGKPPVLEVEMVVWQALPFHTALLTLLSQVLKFQQPNTLNVPQEITLDLTLELPIRDLDRVLINNFPITKILHDMISKNLGIVQLPQSIQNPLSKALAQIFSPQSGFLYLQSYINSCKNL